MIGVCFGLGFAFSGGAWFFCVAWLVVVGVGVVSWVGFELSFLVICRGVVTRLCFEVSLWPHWVFLVEAGFFIVEYGVGIVSGACCVFCEVLPCILESGVIGEVL